MGALKSKASDAAATDHKSVSKRGTAQEAGSAAYSFNSLWHSMATDVVQHRLQTGGAGRQASSTANTSDDEKVNDARFVVQKMCAECADEQQHDDSPTVQQKPSAGNTDTAELNTEELATTTGQTVQMWSCDEYSKPTCTVQAKCAVCDGDNDAVQHRAAGSNSVNGSSVHHTAAQGLAKANAPLPHAESIQRSFGRHDISGVRAGVGGVAAKASARMGALAYTRGDKIAFSKPPDLHLAAHEATHTIQQRSGLKLPGNVGQRGDRWERHADNVADAVVAGESAEPLLNEVAPASGQSRPAKGDGLANTVQHQITAGARRQIEDAAQTDLPASNDSAASVADGESSTEPVADSAEEEKPAEDTAAAEQSDPETACEAAEDNGSAESAPEEPAASNAQEQPQPPPAESTAMGGCYSSSASAPPDDTPEPDKDAPPNDVEEQSEVTFARWEEANDDCECEVGAELQQGAGDASGQVVASTAITPDQGQAPSAKQGQAPSGGSGSDQGQAPTGGGQALAGGVEHGGSDEGLASLVAGEGARDTAIDNYDAAARKMDNMPARAQQLSEQLDFAEVKRGSATEEVRRASALSQIRMFLQDGASQIAEAVDFVQNKVPARLGEIAESIKADIDDAIAESKGQISERIASARAEAISQAQASQEQILSGYESSVAAVNTQTDAAISSLESAYTTSTQAISSREETALGVVNERFAKGREDHNATGEQYSGAAVTRGQQHVDAYEPCKGDYSDDGFWDGCLTVRRAKAQQDAACKTASGFAKNMLEVAQRKGYNLREQRTQYRCAVIAGAGQSQSALDSIIEKMVSGLESGRAGTLGGLAQARDLNLQAVEGTMRATLQTLADQEHSQAQAVNDSGYIQQVAIEQLTHQIATGLAEGVGSAMLSLESTLAQLREQFTSAGVPEAGALTEQLEAAKQGLGSGMGTLLETMEEGVVSAKQQLQQAGLNAEGSLQNIVNGNDSLAAQVESSHAGQLSTLVAAANTAMLQLTDRQVQKAQQSAAQGADSMAQLVSGFNSATEQIYTKVDEAIATSATELARDLDNMAEKLDAKIVSEAWKAASKEQPAWKSVVAIVLIILVIIASIVVSVLTLGAGAPFLAVVLVGAIVGAITAGLIQVINNWASGEQWDTGLVQAMVIGAVGGALGGAIGAGANGIAQAAVQGAVRAGASTAARTALNVGINLAGDMLAEGLTQSFGYVAFGQQFNWQGFVMAGGMSMASSVRAGPGGGARGADVSAPPPPRANTSAVRGAVGDLAFGMGLAGAVEFLDVLAGGKFDLNRFASAAASGAAGARAAARGAQAPAPPRPAPTTRLGRARARVAGARDSALGRLAIPESSSVHGRVQRGLGAVENWAAGGASGLLGRGKGTADTAPAADVTPVRASDAEPSSAPVRTSEPDIDTQSPIRQSDSEAGEIPRTRTDSPDTDTAPNRLPEADTIEGRSTTVRIGGETHEVTIRRIGDRKKLILCSNQCGEVLLKIERMQRGLAPDSEEWRALNTLRDQAIAADLVINSVTPASKTAAIDAADQTLASLRAAMVELETRFPNLIDPNVPVVGAAPATQAPTGRRVDIRAHLPAGVDTTGLGPPVRLNLSDGVPELPTALRNLPDDVGFVYVLRDNVTGEVLKVGETSDVTQRATDYESAARLHAMGRSVSLEVQPVRTSKSFPAIRDVEDALRSSVEAGVLAERAGLTVPAHMPPLPWDGTTVTYPSGQRKGRLGQFGEPTGQSTPGTYDAKNRTRAHPPEAGDPPLQSGESYWWRERKWGASGYPSPPAHIPAWKPPSFADAIASKPQTPEALHVELSRVVKRMDASGQRTSIRGLGAELGVEWTSIRNYLKKTDLTIDQLKAMDTGDG